MDWLHGEPALDDALTDPVICAVMARDGVERETLRRLIRDIRRVHRWAPRRDGMSRPVRAERHWTAATRSPVVVPL